jgi:hypothetical protein
MTWKGGVGTMMATKEIISEMFQVNVKMSALLNL